MRTPERKDGGKRTARSRPNWRGRLGFTLVEILAVMAILSIISVSLFTMFQQGTGTWRKYSAWTEANLKARQILEMMTREIRGAVVITAPRGPDAVTDDLSRADFRGLNGQNPPGPDSTWNSVTLQGWRTREQKFSDQVFFVAPATNSARQELCLVGYWIEDPEGDTSAPLPPDGVPGNSKDDILRRCYLTDGGFVAPSDEWKEFNFVEAKSSGENRELALNVRQLEIKYYDYELRGGSTPVLREYNAWDSRPTTFAGKEKGTTPTKDDDDRVPVAVRITIIVGDENDVIKPLKLSTIVYLENAPRTGTTGG